MSMRAKSKHCCEAPPAGLPHAWLAFVEWGWKKSGIGFGSRASTSPDRDTSLTEQRLARGLTPISRTVPTKCRLSGKAQLAGSWTGCGINRGTAPSPQGCLRDSLLPLSWSKGLGRRWSVLVLWVVRAVSAST